MSSDTSSSSDSYADFLLQASAEITSGVFPMGATARPGSVASGSAGKCV